SSDREAARVSIPRDTGLGRAFHDITIRPINGGKFLVNADHKRTYGKSPREFPDDMFRFALVGGRHTALVFARKGDPDYGTVAYWLRREVTQEQDRTLLPSDQTYLAVGTAAARRYARKRIYEERTGRPA